MTWKIVKDLGSWYAMQYHMETMGQIILVAMLEQPDWYPPPIFRWATVTLTKMRGYHYIRRSKPILKLHRFVIFCNLSKQNI